MIKGLRTLSLLAFLAPLSLAALQDTASSAAKDKFQQDMRRPF